MGAAVARLLGLHGLIVYLIVGLLVFAEDALFVGFVLPGETAAIVGGVAASRGHVALALMSVIVVVAAVTGDSVGYAIGARYGPRLLSARVLRRRSDRLDAARDSLARRGGVAVFVGRFVAFVRTAMPFLAGSSRMPLRRFLVFDIAAGLTWGIGNVILGYLAGNSYVAIERSAGTATAIFAAALVVAVLVTWRARRWWRHRSPPPT